MELPQVYHLEVYQLDRFCAIWTAISFFYTAFVWIWLFFFGESALLNWKLIKQLIASFFISNITWTLLYEGNKLGSSKDVLMGMLGGISLFSAIRTYNIHVKGRIPKPVDMRDKVVIITGANAGIGFETAKSLVEMGAHVIMASRDKTKAKEAIQKISDELLLVSHAERNPDGPSIKGKISYMELDLKSLDSVHSFIKEFKSRKFGLDVLILNAGVMMSKREVTVDGCETTFQVNHLSHFLLTNELMDLLEQSSDGRVVVLTSILYRTMKEFDFSDIQTVNNYGMFKAYKKSKLANMMFGLQLNARLREKNSKVIVNMVHPGMVISNITKNMQWYMRLSEILIYPFLVMLRKQPEHGAYTSVFAATSPYLRNSSGDPLSGLLLLNCEPIQIAQVARYIEDNEKLWKISEDLCKGKKKA